jgi:hypothetical protein
MKGISLKELRKETIKTEGNKPPLSNLSASVDELNIKK